MAVVGGRPISKVRRWKMADALIISKARSFVDNNTKRQGFEAQKEAFLILALFGAENVRGYNEGARLRARKHQRRRAKMGKF